LLHNRDIYSCIHAYIHYTNNVGERYMYMHASILTRVVSICIDII
jgi:hypothetical protein